MSSNQEAESSEDSEDTVGKRRAHAELSFEASIYDEAFVCPLVHAQLGRQQRHSIVFAQLMLLINCLTQSMIIGLMVMRVERTEASFQESCGGFVGMKIEAQDFLLY